MEDGTMMIGYNPLTTKGYVNFFRVIVTNPLTNPSDMDFILDEMDRLGADLWFVLLITKGNRPNDHKLRKFLRKFQTSITFEIV